MATEAAGVDDPIGYFLQDLEYHGRSERTQEAYERVLRQFEGFLADSDQCPGGPFTPDEAGQRECMAWVHSIRAEHRQSTIATYASYLHRFYTYMIQVEVFESNPMALVVEEMDETIEKDPQRRDVSVSEMRRFVDEIVHPLDRTVIVTLLKTGMRVGELCNLDLRDLAIDDEDLEAVHTLGGRGQLNGRAGSIYVASDVGRGDIINGERRRAANKRRRATTLPVDDELHGTLRRWLAVRPDAVSDADPLFLSTRDDWGHRLTPPMVRSIVSKYARAMDWYHTGGGATENVTPHYFRHFFTTHLRDRTGDRGIVKYLRGDVADDIIDTYTHNWGDRVREVYEENIYQIM
ncbi:MULTISPECIES: tyrosine-type recombinase/integrase [Halococcus]|uniref:Integrase family protein n=1 Tax=Halococcus salifodinae DSM 8989 TaxID=1227456 RepID=M0N6T9_9EURY|nr:MULTISPECIES: tyrosine-type recombinase/integrase [Halococcus]EMA53273.1 integrase family protein [Halococcus salifodinae DSM 8989]